MTIPRTTKIDLAATPYYHCMTRCVRRAYLYGIDEKTGQDFRHRKEWLINRIEFLANIFAIHICGYAIMNNHYHLVLYVNADKAKQWSNEEVRERWSNLFPADAAKIDPIGAKQQADQKIDLWRERLMNISWFMRCLNENIARRSNQEDNCNGRFWEGRFKSQALLDEGGLLAAMVYVDLNPIRAKQALTPEESEFTSIYERIKCIRGKVKDTEINAKKMKNIPQPKQLMPFRDTWNKKKEGIKIDFDLHDYLQLVDATGRIIREDKRGRIPDHLLPILTRLNISAKKWIPLVNKLESCFSYAIGHPMLLAEFGSLKCQHLKKGLSLAKQAYYATA